MRLTASHSKLYHMATLANKRVIVGISGGIAAYKAAELVRRLREVGAEVRVTMTRAATQFITPLTLQAVSGQPVHLQLLDTAAEAGMGHIELARWADLVVIAPASANVLAKLAQGRADDLLTTLCLATAAPVAVAPAMNQQMWRNRATQANVATLAARGIHIWGPDAGAQACGDIGPGRLLEIPALVAHCAAVFETGALTDLRVLVTAGPTWEAWDPVRGLTNRSSGKMGYAVATAAMEAGARVTLVSGPTALADPARVETIRIVSAADMLAAVTAHAASCDIFIAAAAVADYRPARVLQEKLKKQGETLVLELEKNPDILAAVAARADAPFTVGFAAETEDVQAHATTKLHAKGVDLIAANRVGQAGSGFDTDDNQLTLLDASGATELPLLPKSQLARLLIEEIARRYHAKNKTQNSRPAHRR